MVLHISGRVHEMETGKPVPGITVEAYDADGLSDGLLGRARTNEDGHYDLPAKPRVGLFRSRPNAYVLLKDPGGRILKSTRRSHLREVDENVVIDVPISCFKLVEAGLLHPEQIPAELMGPSTDPGLRRWRLHPAEEGDPILAAIEGDLTRQRSVLGLLAAYMRSLRQSIDNQAPAFVKMARLFALGATPRSIQGHHYGAILGLRMSAEKRALSHLDNVIGLLWGATLDEESPWVGKTFEPIEDERLVGLTGMDPDPQSPAFLGTNHFNRLDWRPANLLSYQFLSRWLHLADASPRERDDYGYDRSGGHFIAVAAPSVAHETPREVFSVNYRWPSMRNRPPLCWLIDELVQVADGLYLGQLLFATRRLLAAYDQRRSPGDYGYNHMGYFALWDGRWNIEARRFFPFLEIPPPIDSSTGARGGDEGTSRDSCGPVTR